MENKGQNTHLPAPQAVSEPQQSDKVDWPEVALTVFTNKDFLVTAEKIAGDMTHAWNERAGERLALEKERLDHTKSVENARLEHDRDKTTRQLDHDKDKTTKWYRITLSFMLGRFALAGASLAVLYVFATANVLSKEVIGVLMTAVIGSLFIPPSKND